MADKEPLQSVQQILTDLKDTKGVKEYVIFNYEGIPMRYEGRNWTHAKAVHYSGLINDFLMVARKLILKELKSIFQNDGDLDYIRLRTKKGTEFIITSDKEFTICVVQECNPNLADPDDDDVKEGGAPPAGGGANAAPKAE